MTERIRAARYRLAAAHPYIADAILRLEVVEEPALPDCAAVDKYWRLYYNPRMVGDADMKELSLIILHEVLHLLRDHMGRAEGLRLEYNTLPFRLYNLAADLEIADDIGMPPFPSDYELPDHRLAEEYYSLLLEDAVNLLPVAVRGSCADGVTRPWERGVPSPAHPGLTPAEADSLRRLVARRVWECRGRGSVPGSLLRWAEELLGRPVDPCGELLRMVQNAVCVAAAGRPRRTYARPSRRTTVAGDLLLPGRRTTMPTVAVIIDTSLSVSDEELGRALGFVQGLLDVYATAVHVLAADAAVGFVGRVTSPSQVRLVGGGGTDMAKAVDEALELRPPPQVILVVTDGMTPWGEDPGVDVVAVLLARPSTPPPEWVTCVDFTMGSTSPVLSRRSQR